MSTLVTLDMSLDTARVLAKTADITKVVAARLGDYSVSSLPIKVSHFPINSLMRGGEEKGSANHELSPCSVMNP